MSYYETNESGPFEIVVQPFPEPTSKWQASQKSPLAIASILGILKADCIYVPVDPESPPQRACTIMKSAEPTAILADEYFAVTRSAAGVRVRHCCEACGLSLDIRNSCCGLSEPGFKTRLAKSCIVGRNQCSLADCGPRIKRFWVGDDFPGILKHGQAPPD
jgi:hypothetical protein